MGIFNLKCFELEKKKDGLYRCKGGWLADTIFLGMGIIYCFVLLIISPIMDLFRTNPYAGLNKEQIDYFKQVPRGKRQG